MKNKQKTASRNRRVVTIGMLRNKIDEAQSNGEKTITLRISDAEWILYALVCHWKYEKKAIFKKFELNEMESK